MLSSVSKMVSNLLGPSQCCQPGDESVLPAVASLVVSVGTSIFTVLRWKLQKQWRWKP